jgi:hypothetical protein
MLDQVSSYRRTSSTGLCIFHEHGEPSGPEAYIGSDFELVPEVPTEQGKPRRSCLNGTLNYVLTHAYPRAGPVYHAAYILKQVQAAIVENSYSCLFQNPLRFGIDLVDLFSGKNL